LTALSGTVRPTRSIEHAMANAVDQTALFSLRKNFITKESGFELF
jgi:hypothetical protein